MIDNMDKAVNVGLLIGVVSFIGALTMGIVTGKAVTSISRRHEEYSKIRAAYILSLIFIETIIIYGLLVVILLVFVL